MELKLSSIIVYSFLFIFSQVSAQSSKPVVEGNCVLSQSSPVCHPGLFNFCLSPDSPFLPKVTATASASPTPTAVYCPLNALRGGACYDNRAVCKVQSNGQCGWTNSGDFAKCLKDEGSLYPAEPYNATKYTPTQLDGCRAISSSECDSVFNVCVDGSQLNSNSTSNNTNKDNKTASCATNPTDGCFLSINTVCKRNSANNSCGWDYSSEFLTCLKTENGTKAGGNSNGDINTISFSLVVTLLAALLSTISI